MHYFFLPLTTVLKIHEDLIDVYGGSHGIRDEKLLVSALAQVQSTFGGEYLHRSIYEMGAAYLFHIIQNHPFIDGNKRTGISVAAIFLSLHGIELNCKVSDLDKYVERIGSGKETKGAVASWLKENTTKG
ncbi:MAG: type II toxin-antitoxin system death-on-curing family toxin [Chlamydiales bacterium]|nr:type II toxin-antitoxin system death-on-curing family toxin [Chlamydiales bacterium]